MSDQSPDRSLRGRNVLITGATGFIGSHLAIRLVADGANVSALARQTSALTRLASVAHSVQIMPVDLRDTSAVRDALRAARPDIVFHIAADTSLRHVSRDWEGVMRSTRENVDMTLGLLRDSLECGVGVFVRTGSIEEYGDGDTPFGEHQRERPISPYSASHVAVTHYLEMLQRDTDASIVTVRPALTYGPAQSDDFFVPSLINACLSGTDFALSAGTQRRDFLYVDDLVEALVRAATRRLVPGGVINAGSGASHTIRDVAERIHRIVGATSKLAFGARPPRAHDPEELLLAIDAARTRLGWRPATSLDEGLTLTIDWYRKRASQTLDRGPATPL